MRRLVLLLLLPLAGCGAAGHPDTGSQASASCAAVLRWHGTRYAGASLPGRAPQRVRRLGRGVVPGCADTVVNGRASDPGPTRSRPVWRIRRVAPRLAVMVEGDDRTVYVSRRCRRACLARISARAHRR